MKVLRKAVMVAVLGCFIGQMSGCASSNLADVWQDPSYKAAPLSKILVIAVRKDPDEGHVRIKARPDSKIDLRPLYDKILELDHEGDWFYHQGGKMLLNGSGKSTQTPTPLSLEKIIELIKQIYG